MRRPLILFFNPFFATFPDTGGLECGQACDFTQDRARMAEADAIVIHLPNCERIWEARKYPGQLWVAWSQESDVTVPALLEPKFMSHFDLAMTYRRDADVWCPYIPSDATERLLAPAPPKTERAPAVLFQSAHYDRSERYAFAFELMKKVRVDSYGDTLKNRALPGPDRGGKTKLDIISRYKFCLALENSRSLDYVTEKFFHPLMAGSVPVYRGAPNVGDFAPGEKCFVNADDFSSPGALADYLNHLDGNETAYREYFHWKSDGLSAKFQAMLRPLSSHPFCRLSDLVAARMRSRGGRERDSARDYARPLYFRRWRPRRIARQVGFVSRLAVGRLVRSSDRP